MVECVKIWLDTVAEAIVVMTKDEERANVESFAIECLACRRLMGRRSPLCWTSAPSGLAGAWR